MRLKYIFHGQKDKPSDYVKSDRIPRFQPSVALESYLEEVISRKLQLRGTKSTTIFKKILNNVKKADKGSCVIMFSGSMGKGCIIGIILTRRL